MEFYPPLQPVLPEIESGTRVAVYPAIQHFMQELQLEPGLLPHSVKRNRADNMVHDPGAQDYFCDQGRPLGHRRGLRRSKVRQGRFLDNKLLFFGQGNSPPQGDGQKLFFFREARFDAFHAQVLYLKDYLRQDYIRLLGFYLFGLQGEKSQEEKKKSDHLGSSPARSFFASMVHWESGKCCSSLPTSSLTSLSLPASFIISAAL